MMQRKCGYVDVNMNTYLIKVLVVVPLFGYTVQDQDQSHQEELHHQQDLLLLLLLLPEEDE